jgi:hypothetical protein
VFKRLPGTKNKAGTGPKIDEIYRPSVPQMLASKEIAPKIQAKGSAVFEKALKRTVEAELKKIAEG